MITAGRLPRIDLCELFLSRGHDVVCMDNFLTSPTTSSISSAARVLVIKQDVTTYIHIDGPLDYVLHFASPASPIDTWKADQTLKVGSRHAQNHRRREGQEGAYLIARRPRLWRSADSPEERGLMGQVIRSAARRVREAKRFAEA